MTAGWGVPDALRLSSISASNFKFWSYVLVFRYRGENKKVALGFHALVVTVLRVIAVTQGVEPGLDGLTTPVRATFRQANDAEECAHRKIR